MRIVFFISAFIGLAYFLCRRRSFDFFSIGYISSLVYFLPGFFGYALDIYKGIIPLINRTYFVMLLVIWLILIATFLFDQFLSRKRKRHTKTIKGSLRLTHICATLIAILSLFFMIIRLGSGFLVREIMVSDRFSIVWNVSSTIGIFASVINKKKWTFAICIFFLFIDLYIGNRSSFAIAIIGTLILVLSQKGKISLISEAPKWLLIIGFAIAIFLFAYKHIYLPIRASNWNQVLNSLGSFNFYIYSITHSEPFLNSLVLNEILRTNFYVGHKHMLKLIFILIPFSSDLGADVISTKFTRLFQPALFPEHTDYGMASTIWGEAWSVGGWIWLIITVLVYISGLLIGSWLISTSNSLYRFLSVSIFTYWAFYIHRNSMDYQLIIERRMVVFAVIVIALSIILVKIGIRTSNIGFGQKI